MIRLAALLFAAMLLTLPGAGHAQTFTVSSISPSSLGTVVAAPTGSSTFRASASTGTVTNLSGNAVRISGGSVRSLVTVSCNNNPNCASDDALVQITTSGAPTGRAGALQNFTVSTSGATAVITLAPGAGNSISFRIGPVGRRGSKTFWVGYDMPINGDNSSGSTGNAGAAMVVTVSRTNGNAPSQLASTIGATVYRGLSLGHSANMSFGRISLPRIGTGTVSLTPSGVLTVTGAGVGALSAVTPSAAVFGLSGEGGQSVSVTVPATFAMTGPGGAISVTTNPDVSGSQVLSGAIGAAGTLAIRVGGNFSLPSTLSPGSYTGTFTVTAQYN
jgi:hypothetical protein